MTSKGVMFDSNIFDKVLDGDIDPGKISSKFFLYVTHIQEEEIKKCKDAIRRNKLVEIFHRLDQQELNVKGPVWGHFKWGKADWGPGKHTRDVMKGNQKHAEDAMIAETAMNNGLLLITEDTRLRNRMNELGGEAIGFEDFIKQV